MVQPEWNVTWILKVGRITIWMNGSSDRSNFPFQWTLKDWIDTNFWMKKIWIPYVLNWNIYRSKKIIELWKDTKKNNLGDLNLKAIKRKPLINEIVTFKNFNFSHFRRKFISFQIKTTLECFANFFSELLISTAIKLCWLTLIRIMQNTRFEGLAIS